MPQFTLPRALIAVAAGTAVLVGAIAVAASNTATVVADEDYTIAILDTAFNPSTCIVNRASGHSVRFINKGKVPHQVRSVNTGTNSLPLFETTVLAPGETSRPFNFTAKSSYPYYDVLNPALTGKVEAGDGAEFCVEAPPTPTPTNTPTITPTPTITRTPTNSPTPTLVPTRTPDPRKAIIPMIAKDEDY